VHQHAQAGATEGWALDRQGFCAPAMALH